MKLARAEASNSTGSVTRVKAVAAAIRGETPEKRVDSPAAVVTLENVDTPEIDQLLHPDLSQYLE